jgi:hypothetical protein
MYHYDEYVEPLLSQGPCPGLYDMQQKVEGSNCDVRRQFALQMHILLWTSLNLLQLESFIYMLLAS